MTAVSVLVSMALLAAAAPAPDSLLDHFNGIDGATWNVSNGWSNGAWYLNDWRRSSIRTGSNGLSFSFERSNSKNGYSSGEIQSKRLFRYGYFSSRFTAAKGEGLITGFFTYTGKETHQRWNEIDVEIMGKDTRTVQMTYHVDDKSVAKNVPLPFDAADEAHTYAFDWEPTFIKWYIDGKLVLERTEPEVAQINEPQRLMFDLWGTNVNPAWAGVFKPSTATFTSQLKCVGWSSSWPGPANVGQNDGSTNAKC